MTTKNEKNWTERYNSGWLKHFIDNKSIDWKLYKYVRNTTAPASKGLKLSQSRLLLISSGGAYLPGRDKPFNAKNLLGDYTIRTFSSETPLAALEYAHDHYDQTSVREDPQVLLPIDHLKALAQEGVIGGLSETIISFMGYQPLVYKVMKKTVPAILDIVKKESIDAVLLVPS